MIASQNAINQVDYDCVTQCHKSEASCYQMEGQVNSKTGQVCSTQNLHVYHFLGTLVS